MQTYPAMEYRFNPERITVTADDVICFVWSGKQLTTIRLVTIVTFAEVVITLVDFWLSFWVKQN